LRNARQAAVVRRSSEVSRRRVARECGRCPARTGDLLLVRARASAAVYCRRVWLRTAQARWTRPYLLPSAAVCRFQAASRLIASASHKAAASGRSKRALGLLLCQEEESPPREDDRAIFPGPDRAGTPRLLLALTTDARPPSAGRPPGRGQPPSGRISAASAHRTR
jgi:hypothetical protein